MLRSSDAFAAVMGTSDRDLEGDLPSIEAAEMAAASVDASCFTVFLAAADAEFGPPTPTELRKLQTLWQGQDDPDEDPRSFLMRYQLVLGPTIDYYGKERVLQLYAERVSPLIRAKVLDFFHDTPARKRTLGLLCSYAQNQWESRAR
jgi:hypothetical protein